MVLGTGEHAEHRRLRLLVRRLRSSDCAALVRWRRSPCAAPSRASRASPRPSPPSRAAPSHASRACVHPLRLILRELRLKASCSTRVSTRSASTFASPPVAPQPLQLGGKSSEEGEHDRSREAKAQGLTVHGHPVAVPPFCLATSQPASVLVRKSGGAVGDSAQGVRICREGSHGAPGVRRHETGTARS